MPLGLPAGRVVVATGGRRRDSMADAPVPAPAQLSPRSERAGLVLASLFWAAALAFLSYGAFNGELQLPTRGSGTVVVRGWAAWVFCLVPILAFGAHISVIKHRVRRIGNKAAIAILVGIVIAMMAVILITVPGPLNPFGTTQ
jgi:hypothetical protein